MSNVITVIAIQVDTAKAVFIDSTAKRHTVHQTDPRLKTLLDEIMPLLVADQAEARRTGKPQKGVQVDLANYSMFKDFEEKTGGFVRFFRAAKEKVKSFFEVLVPSDDTTVEEDNIALQKKMDEETLKAAEEAVSEPIVEEVTPKTVVTAPVTPTPSRPRYEEMKQDLKELTTDSPLPPDETLVAVVNGVVIPGIDQLKPYIAHALKHNSVKAVTAFLERLALAIDRKGHSIPDVMKFIEQGDLPLAEDGSIIAYKILNRRENGSFTYVDCRSGKVTQRVGTWVRIPEKMVDPNRHNDCSHGLHVARRGYLRSFSGNVCVLIKMAPEDIVAVPQYDANKVRTCSYFIIGELSKHVHDVLRSGRSMTSDPEAAAMLQKAINGDHIGVLEEVWVNGPEGTKVEVKNAVDSSVAKQALKEDAERVVETTENASELDTTVETVSADPVNPRELNEKIKAETTKVEKQMSMTKAELAREAFEAKDYPKVREIKKAAKVSYERLGFTAAEIDQINVAPVVVAETPKAEPKKKEAPAKPVKAKKEKPAPKPVPEAVVKAATASASKTGSVSDQAMELYLENKWDDLWALKKAKKKSWDYLGFSAKEVADIEKHKPTK